MLASHSVVMVMTALEAEMTAPATSFATLCSVAVTTLPSPAPVKVFNKHYSTITYQVPYAHEASELAVASYPAIPALFHTQKSSGSWVYLRLTSRWMPQPTQPGGQCGLQHLL